MIRRHGADRGSAALLVVLMAAGIVAAALIALATVGPVLIDANRARSAADAAALAGAHDGREAAAAMAAVNGASLVGWEEHHGALPGSRTVTVEVRLGAASARARATTDP